MIQIFNYKIKISNGSVKRKIKNNNQKQMANKQIKIYNRWDLRSFLLIQIKQYNRQPKMIIKHKERGLENTKNKTKRNHKTQKPLFKYFNLPALQRTYFNDIVTQKNFQVQIIIISKL